MTRCDTLANGIRVVTDRMEHVATATVGFYVAAGSRHERAEESGVSHFIEHLVFKGTPTRSPRDIVLAFDAVGGDVNAATEREITYYYGKVLGQHVPMAIEVLSDMLLHPKLAEEDVDLELLVIEEEISRYEDTPSELVHDQFAKALWPGQAIGRSILGDVECLRALGPEGVRSYMTGHYTGPNIVVSAAGDVHHEQVVDLIAAHWSELDVPSSGPAALPAPVASPDVVCDERDIEQVHFCLGGEAYSMRDEGRYAGAIIDCALGGAASSRLFQEIREKRGLVYSVYSSTAMHLDSGYESIYAGTRPENLTRVLELIREQFADLLAHGLSSEEVRAAKEYHRGATLMALDGVGHRAARNARSLIAFDRVVPTQEVIAGIEAVTTDQVHEAIHRLFASKPCLAAIGPVKRSDLAAAVL
ncbi:MAG TPA: pitrilysin family protein [Armatimonadota bacterium]|nr:pitrilysin family protein [Armatimonadota bacterium]HQK94937.1 pitrilysin family protein [Armatimonadota bacterium]